MIGPIVAGSIPLKVGWSLVSTAWRLAGADAALTDVAWVVRKPETDAPAGP
jgi:hypothetical protein